MKYKKSIIRTIIFWALGLMNTIFIKSEDIGTWKNYTGYVLLILALIDTIISIIIIFKKAKQEQIKFFFLKVLTIVLPFYFIYIPLLQEDSKNPKIKTLWIYILTGFLVYFTGIVIYNLIK